MLWNRWIRLPSRNLAEERIFLNHARPALCCVPTDDVVKQPFPDAGGCNQPARPRYHACIGYLAQAPRREAGLCDSDGWERGKGLALAMGLFSKLQVFWVRVASCRWNHVRGCEFGLRKGPVRVVEIAGRWLGEIANQSKEVPGKSLLTV